MKVSRGPCGSLKIDESKCAKKRVSFQELYNLMWPSMQKIVDRRLLKAYKTPNEM